MMKGTCRVGSSGVGFREGSWCGGNPGGDSDTSGSDCDMCTLRRLSVIGTFYEGGRGLALFAGEGVVVMGVAFVGVWRPLLVRGLGGTVIAVEDAWDGMDGWVGLDYWGVLFGCGSDGVREG